MINMIMDNALNVLVVMIKNKAIIDVVRIVPKNIFGMIIIMHVHLYILIVIYLTFKIIYAKIVNILKHILIYQNYLVVQKVNIITLLENYVKLFQLLL